MFLAIDTSTNIVSIALFDTSVEAEHTWMADQRHTTQLLPEVEHVLARLGVKMNHLKGVVVALGPGSFNGLRVGLSAAKGLCFALEIPIAGVGTLEALAYQYAYVHMPIRPITDAGRGQFNTALYRMIDGKWTEIEAPHLANVEEIKDKISEPTFVCGDIRKEAVVHLRRELGEQIAMPSAAGALQRAGYLAELGAKKLHKGMADDLASLQPIYLRRPAITKSRRTDALAVHSQDARAGKFEM